MGNKKETCSVEDCNKPHSREGYCKSHYSKFVAYPKRRAELLADPEKYEQHKKHVMELYYARHGIQKRQKRERAKRKSRQMIKMLGGKCESCGEKFNPDLERSNLDFHHRHYDEKDKKIRRKWGYVPNIVHEIEVLIKEGKNPKKKFALLCKQCNSIEAFVRIDKKKAFETFSWLYEEGYFDEALSDDKSLRKITEFLK